ncbi:MAG: NAD(P)/FAD-dependent oxidoreductase [Candidatus Binatia bacterium]
MDSPAPERARPRVVVVGGGFGGLNAARALRAGPVEVTLVDRRNHHLFQPLLYQVATAALNPSDIAAPIRRILRKQRNCRVLLAEATAIDVAGRRVVLADGELPYDYVVVATGATHAYFGHDEWAPFAPGLKSIEDALEIRRRVLLAYEAAERATDADARRAWLTFVVVGAGPTGVELAGALSEIARHALENDFRTIDPEDARIVLIEGAGRVLGTFPPELSEKAMAQLRRLGVEVRVGTQVTGIEDGAVQLGSERVAARTILWAAGVKASPLATSLGGPLDRAGRVLVDPTLALPGHPEVFVIGDVAVHQQDGKGVTGLAAVAVQEGPHAARNILRAVRGEPLLPFHYVDKGTLATIGRAAAVADLGRLRLSGLVAWLAWLFVHIFLLIGFRNRFLVMFSWAWTYVTYERGARLITGDVRAVSPRR